MSDSLPLPLGRPINRDARAQKRAQILEGARQCFVREGFHKATIATIGKVAKVNVASIYQYFENKDALIEALVKQMTAQQMAQLSSFDPDQFDYHTLRKFVEGIYVTDAGREMAALRAEMVSEASRNPIVSQHVVDASRAVVQTMVGFVKKFQDRGDIPSDLDADDAGADLAFFHEGIQMHIPMKPDRREQLLEVHVAFIAGRLGIPKQAEN